MNRSRLDAVLRVRETALDERRMEWSAAFQEERQLRSRAEQLCGEILAEQERRRESLRAGGISLAAVRNQHDYETSLRHELETLRQEGVALEARLEASREELRKAKQQHEPLQQLLNRHQQQLAEAIRRAEERELDEVVSRRAHW